MSEQREFSRGGLIPGGPTFVPMERLGICANGHCLYRIAGGPPEHIIPATDIAQAMCAETIPTPDSPDGREGAA